MDEDVTYIDNVFENGVENHAELPTEQVWRNLETALQKKKLAYLTNKYKRWKWTTAALLLLSMAAVIYSVRLTWKYKMDVKKKTPESSSYNNNQGASLDSNIKGPITVLKVFRAKADSNNVNKEMTESEKRSLIPNKESKPGLRTMPAKNDEHPAIAKFEKQESKTRFSSRSLRLTRGAVHSTNKTLIGEKTSLKVRSRHATIKKGDVMDVSAGRSSNLSYDTLDSSFVKMLSEKASSKDMLPTSELHELQSSPGIAPVSLLTKPEIIPYPLKVNASIINISNAKSIRLTSRKIHPGKFIAGISYSRNSISTILEANRPDYREDNYLQLKNHEKNRMSSVFGFSLERFLGRNFTIGSGISFSNFTTDISNKPLVARRDDNGKINYRISTSSGYAYYSVIGRPQPTLADSIKTLSAKSTVKYISVPFGLRYHFYAGNFGITPALLLDVNFKTKGTITTIQSLERSYTSNIVGLKSSYLDGNLGVSLGCFLNNRTEISLFPSARLALSNAIQGNPVTAKRNVFGIAGSLNVSF